MVKIKICGLQQMEDVEMVNLLHPDYVGFIFAPSRRQINLAQAQTLKQHLDPSIQSVGVFVDAPTETICSAAQSGCIDVIQLHGAEPAALIPLLKQETGLPIIKAIRVQSRKQLLLSDRLPCDFLLLDTYTPGMAGGSGQPFDWSCIPPLTKPYFVAGGLTPETVSSVFQSCTPYGVDVSSGVETDGHKDFQKIQQFMKQVKDGDFHETR